MLIFAPCRKDRCIVLMLKKICNVLIVCALVSGLSERAFAQRTMDGQMFASVSYVNGLFPERALTQIGGEANLGQYILSSCYWEAGVRYNPLTKMQTVGSLTAFGGFNYRIASTRNRAFNLYAGGRLFLGVDYTEGSNPVEEIVIGTGSSVQVTDIEVEPGKTRFMIGIDPAVEMEWFFVKKIALVVRVSAPVKFMTQQQFFSGRAGAGLRFNF